MNFSHEYLSRILILMAPKWLKRVQLENEEMILTVLPGNIIPCLTFFKKHTNTQYKLLVDLCGLDFPNKTQRFEIVYNLLSIFFNSRITVKVSIDETTPIDSCFRIYSSASWCEREVWDMFGVFFTNHPDLRRILTDYGFEGHPLRKDFPLTGYKEICYDDSEKRIINKQIQMTQEFRMFKFLSPWQNNK